MVSLISGPPTEALPLRGIIIVPSIVKGFVQFLTFGLAQTVPPDQDSCCMSKALKQVLQQLGITHCPCGECPPESQGAVERSNQTLKYIL